MTARPMTVGLACPLYPSCVDEGVVLRRTSDEARRPALNSRSRNTRHETEVSAMGTIRWRLQPADWLASSHRTHRTDGRRRCLPKCQRPGHWAVDAAQFGLGLLDEPSSYPSPSSSTGSPNPPADTWRGSRAASQVSATAASSLLPDLC